MDIPARRDLPVRAKTKLRLKTEWAIRPEGTTVGSQGRKPLDSGILEQQSPGGATDCCGFTVAPLGLGCSVVGVPGACAPG